MAKPAEGRPLDLILLLDLLVYAGLAGHVALRARRTGQVALRRLAWFLVTIAVVIGSAPLFAVDAERAGIVALVGGIALYPVLLLRFGAALSTDPRPLERLAGAALALVALSMAAGPFVVGDLGAGLRWDLWVGAVVGILAHVVVFEVLRRQVTAMPSSFVRRRAIALGGGLALVGLSLTAGVFGGALAQLSPRVALVGGALAAGLLSMATVPPRWLQTAFAQPDYDVLLDAEEAVATAPDVVAAVEQLLEGLNVLLVGRAAWLRHEGEIVAATGVPYSAFAGRLAQARRGTIDQFEGPDGEDLWLLHAESLSCRLSVVTGRDPVLYGLDAAELLPRLTRRIAIALAGRQLEERRRAQARAEQQAEHFRLVAELKDDLLSTINHELRTPLTMVTGALELVTARWDEATEAQRRHLVERAAANAQGLSKVVLQVLSLVELRSGVTEIRPTRSTLEALVERAMVGLDGDRRVAVDCAAVEAVVDVALVTRVLHQLIDNALRHTEGPVMVVADATDEHVVVEVRDRGPGVGEDLFGSFQRGGHYLHRTTRGLGVGLSLVTETAGLLGGDVHFHHDGSGTVVTCRLPHKGSVVDIDQSAATEARTADG